MKNNKLKKILIPTAFILSISLASFFFLPFSSNNAKVSITNENNLQSSIVSSPKVISADWTKNTNNVTSTASHIQYPFLNSQSNYDFQNKPIQDYAVDQSNSGIAMFTSSSETGSLDQITKFSTNRQLSEYGKTDIINPGDKQWIVKKSDLATLLSAQDSEISFESMLFSSGGFTTYPSLFVLVNSTNAINAGSFVFRIMWSVPGSATAGQVVPKPGDYKFFQKISSNSTDKYNLLSLESPSTNTIQVIKAQEITDTSTDATFSYKTINDSTSTTPETIPTTTYTYTLPTNIASATLSNNSIPRFLVRYNSDIFIFYQNKKVSNTDLSKYGAWIKLPLSNNLTSISLTNDNVSTLDLSTYSSIFNDNATIPLSFNLLNTNLDNYILTISQSTSSSSTTGKTDYLYINFSLGNIFSNSLNKYKIVQNSISGTNVFIRSIQKLYGGPNNANTTGYLLLDSLNRVSLVDLNFANLKTLYNFSNSSITLGVINYIYTKQGDSNWYAFMTDSKIAQFSGSTLVGRWDQLSSSSSLELAANFNIKNQNEIDSSILYQQIASDDNSGYSNSFTQFLANSRSYSNFIDTTFTDPRLGGALPDIAVTSSTFSASNDRKYSIALTFTQNLRQINPDGSIDIKTPALKQVLLTQTYIFTNAVGSVTAANNETSPFEVPAFIKNKLPSEITNDDVSTYLLKYTNVPPFQISRIPNNLEGSLTITLNVPYIWHQSGSNFYLEQNSLFTFQFGSSSSPFFKSNPLFGRDVSIVLVDDTYEQLNPNLVNQLKLKYSGTLPSQVSLENVLKDFLILGNAFRDTFLIDNGTIVLPKSSDVNLIPFDNEGRLLVRVNFPKIGNDINKEILFYTASVFLTNPTANEIVYFSFKTNEQAINSVISSSAPTVTLKDKSPSEIAQNLNAYNSPEIVTSTLNFFASYSSYFNNLIFDDINNTNSIDIQAIADDVTGTLDLQINLANTLPNSNIFKFERVFYGFKQTGNLSTNLPTFSFGNITSGSSLFSFLPSEITSSQLLNESNLLIFNTEASNLNYNISLEPLDSSGILKVTIKFNNWIETVSGTTQVIPVKEFSRYYSGFKNSLPLVNSLIWKSFIDLNAEYKNVPPSEVVNLVNLNQRTNIGKLMEFANVSQSIISYLSNNNFANDNNLLLTFIPNDTLGSISIIATLRGFLTPINVVTFETSISGFELNNINYDIQFLQENNPRVVALKQKNATSLTEAEVQTLYTIPEINNFNKQIIVEPNDIDGTLVIKINLVDPLNNNQIVKTYEQAYTGFLPYVQETQKVEVLPIVLAILLPILLLLLPIVFLTIYKNKKGIKKVTKLLNKRLDEISRKNSDK